MIAFLLLFALGFLSAALIGLILAPIVYRRIVTLTERRIRASVPLSAAEIRAEKDFARAAFAAENARLAVDLRDERERLTGETARGLKLEGLLAESREESFRLKQTLTETEATAGQLRSDILDRDTRIDTLEAEIGTARHELAERNTEIASLRNRIGWLDGDMEEMKIDLATRETEIENFKAQIQALRDERAQLREELRDRGAAAREADLRFRREQSRAEDLDKRLLETQSVLSDREQQLESHIRDLERLKQKQKDLTAEAREASKALREAERERRALEQDLAKLSPGDGGKPTPAKAAAVTGNGGGKSKAKLTPVAGRSVEALIEHLHLRQAALAERLKKANPGDDNALRQEIAEIAALMVELTARREGEDGPIMQILESHQGKADTDIVSLAERARAHLTGAAGEGR